MRAKFIYEAFKEKSDPVHDMNIGLGTMLEEIIKSIFENDTEKIFFTIQYLYPRTYIQIHLNVPKMNDYNELCNNENIKSYVEKALSQIEHKIFTNVKLVGRFHYHLTDPDDPFDYAILREAPKIFCDISSDIKIPENTYIAIQRMRDSDGVKKVPVIG